MLFAPPTRVRPVSVSDASSVSVVVMTLSGSVPSVSALVPATGIANDSDADTEPAVSAKPIALSP